MTDIIISTYNRYSYLYKCVWSIIATTKTPYRLIVVDDNSTDGTNEFLKDMKDRGLLIYHRNEKNLGTAKTLNKGISMVKSSWFVMANDDMYFYRGWDIEVMRISQIPDCGIVTFFDYTRFKFVKTKQIDDKTIKIKSSGLGACFINKKLFNKAGGFSLPKGKKMGFFASSFCERSLKTNIVKNKHYATVPHYAHHMDLNNSKMCERKYMENYCKMRTSNKNPNKNKI